jgi:hypothetical protein
MRRVSYQRHAPREKKTRYCRPRRNRNHDDPASMGMCILEIHEAQQGRLPGRRMNEPHLPPIQSQLSDSADVQIMKGDSPKR